jgi:hypothetical protein
MFAPDLEEAFEASLQKVSPPRWGRIDQDVAGTGAGNWFLAGTVGYSGRSLDTFRLATSSLQGGPVEGKNAYAWSHLALARHWVQPRYWMLSIGWWQDDKGDPVQYLLDVDGHQPDPSQLTPEAGVVVYPVRRWEFNIPPHGNTPQPINYDLVAGNMMGLVALQVNVDGTLTVEVVPAAQDISSFRGFSGAKRTYRR